MWREIERGGRYRVREMGRDRERGRYRVREMGERDSGGDTE